jgi:hypothetical protein
MAHLLVYVLREAQQGGLELLLDLGLVGHELVEAVGALRVDDK